VCARVRVRVNIYILELKQTSLVCCTLDHNYR